MGRFSKKKMEEVSATIDLNIMPFIDVFSLLSTFLLLSAVYVSLGIHSVQVPFLSNASVPKENKRTLKVSIDVSLSQIELTSSFTQEPINLEKMQFSNSQEGLKRLHHALIALRQSNADSDKVDLFLDDDIEYGKIIELLDLIKLRNSQDPLLPSNKFRHLSSDELFPKVVLGSVIL